MHFFMETLLRNILEPCFILSDFFSAAACPVLAFLFNSQDFFIVVRVHLTCSSLASGSLSFFVVSRIPSSLSKLWSVNRPGSLSSEEDRISWMPLCVLLFIFSGLKIFFVVVFVSIMLPCCVVLRSCR